MSSELNLGADWEQSKRIVNHWHNMWAKEKEKSRKLLERLQDVVDEASKPLGNMAGAFISDGALEYCRRAIEEYKS